MESRRREVDRGRPRARVRLRLGGTLVVLVGLFGLGLLPPARLGATTPIGLQREQLRRLLPAPVGQPPASGVSDRPLRTARVAIWADEDYRRGRGHWQTRVRGLLARVNAFTRPVFGLVLEPVILRPWTRSAPPGALEPVLEELVKLDDGMDVAADWVIGLTAPQPFVTTSVHQLGMARVGGKHFVLRAVVDVEEGRRLRAGFDRVPPDEIEDVYAARVAHKELLVFLHEWAHTLGAGHASAGIMSPSWSPEAAGFGPEETEALFAILEARLAAPGPGGVTAAPAPVPVFAPPGRPRPLVPPPASEAPRGAPGGLAATLARAASAFEDDDPTAAGEALATAVRLARDAGDHRALARAACAIGAVPLGQAALLAVKADANGGGTPDDDAAAACARARAHFGRLADASPVAQVEHAHACARLDAALARDDRAKAERLEREALARFPASAALAARACERLFRSGRVAEATARCRAALAADPALDRARDVLTRIEARPSARSGGTTRSARPPPRP